MSSEGLRYESLKNIQTSMGNALSKQDTIDIENFSLPPPPPPPPVSASSLICNCEKFKNRQILQQSPGMNRDVSKTTDKSGNNIDEETNANIEQSTDITLTRKETSTSIVTASPSSRRLVATRNAATSPNLDLRKIGNIIAASPKISKVNTKQNKSFDSKKRLTNTKTALEKSNSLGDSKPLKQLRTTRSLSPRPPVRHQQAIIVSDENDVISVKVSPNEDYDQQILNKIQEKTFLDNTDQWKSNKIENGRNVSNQKKHKAKSEQTSPNITDVTDTIFSYSNLNNKSTGCLVYVPTDPWLKMTEFKEPKNKSTYLPNRKEIFKDPWIRQKSVDANNLEKSEKLNRFREIKSFSATKFELGKACGHPKLPRKLSILNDDDISITKLTPLQSAPASPHILKATESNFSSEFSLSMAHSNSKTFHLGTPPVSAYNSPTRSTFGYHSINMVQEQFSNIPPPSIAVAALPVGKAKLMNSSFLDVCNPNLLQARHSFSSILSASSQHEDELQLNIRRLSEQMCRTQNSLRGSSAISISDRNVNGSSKQSGRNIPALPTSTGANSADFSDYLLQFRCSEAKKAAAMSSDFNTDLSFIAHKSQTNLDSKMETTC